MLRYNISIMTDLGCKGKKIFSKYLINRVREHREYLIIYILYIFLTVVNLINTTNIATAYKSRSQIRMRRRLL